MPLRWTTPWDLAQALHKAHPDIDRLSLDLEDVRRLCAALPAFDDKAEGADRKTLQAVLWTWMRLAGEDGAVTGEDVAGPFATASSSGGA